MFAHVGSARTDRHNRVLAAYLALVAGFVNAVGLALLNTPTSHVTGNVSRLASDLARGESRAVLAAFAMVAAFFAGAVLAATLTESSRFRSTPLAYASALACEAALLGAFVVIAGPTIAAAHPRVQDATALVLCVAMGMQNSLVTRISGAVVRTTHLTGVVTDLGIEAARWVRWLRKARGAQRPEPVRSVLLATIVSTFAIGAWLGALVARVAHERAMAVPAMAVAAGCFYALWSGRRAADEERG